MSNTRDMTSGSALKHIGAFALPLIIGNLFQQLYNMVDSLIVGRFVGASALAAVGACGSTNFLFFSLSAGLSIGIGVIVSQFFGAKDEKNVKLTIANAFYALSGVAIVISVIAIIFTPQIMRLLQTPQDVIASSILYMRTTCFGIISIALYNGIASILRSLGDSKTPLYFLILASIINVVLDFVFVLYCKWGVFGVALATVASQTISALLSALYAFKKVAYFKFCKSELSLNRQIIAKCFKVGVPVSLQNAMIAISCMVLQGVVNTFGEVVMAAYTITMRIEQLVQQPYSSLGMALTTFSGQNMGANNIERIKKGFCTATFLVLAFSLAMLPLAFFAGKSIIGAFVQDANVIAIGERALKITSLCYFFLGMIYVPRAVLNGCGDTSFAMINGFTEVACRIAYSQVLTRISFIGYWGIWLTTGFTWATTAIVCVIRFARGKWKKKRLVDA